MSGRQFNSNGRKKHNGTGQIILKQVVKEYESSGGNIVALKGIDLQINPGEFFIVTGKSGSGKTTTVNVVAGLDRLTSGEIWVDGMAVHRMNPEQAAKWRSRNMGVIFQTFELLPTLTVLQNVMLPMDFAHTYSISEQRSRAMHLLEQVEIADHAHKPPSAISGGQQQRVAIARAMANDPPFLIADEPTGSLDSVTTRAVIEIFQELAEKGKTVIVVTHDKDIARQAQHMVTLFDGEIIDERIHS